jgi:hypothetical protein
VKITGKEHSYFLFFYVLGFWPVIHVTLKKPLGNSDIPLVVIIDFKKKTRQIAAGISPKLTVMVQNSRLPSKLFASNKRWP